MALDHSTSSSSKRLTRNGKKIRLRKKKRRRKLDLNNMSPIVLVAGIVALLLFLAGFIKMLFLLSSSEDIDQKSKISELDIINSHHNKNSASAESNLQQKSATDFEAKYLSHEIQNGGSMIDNVNLPKAQWPVSIRDEAHNFEEILHPGDKVTILVVPKYWSPPLTGPDNSFGSLMSRELATRFGSYVDGHVDVNYKNKGPEKDRTIFVAIASYRDWQCRYVR